MSFSSIIRAVAGGPKTTRAEGDKPEEDMEDEIVPPEDEDKPEEGAEDNASEDEQPEDSAEDDTPAEEDDAGSLLASKEHLGVPREALPCQSDLLTAADRTALRLHAQE